MPRVQTIYVAHWKESHGGSTLSFLSTVTLTWGAIDPLDVPFGETYTGYRVALQGAVSPPEQFVLLGTLTATFTGVLADIYAGQVQLSSEDLSAVDTTIVRTGDVIVPASAAVTVGLT